MAATQFVFTVAQSREDGPLSFTVIDADGCYTSGQRKTLAECVEKLERSIKNWNRSHPDQQVTVE